MRVSDSLITTVYTIGIEDTLVDAMRLLARHRVGTLPVIDSERRVQGIVLLDDVLLEFMPRFVDLLENADFIHDYGAFEERRRKSVQFTNKPIKDIMRPPYYVTDDSGLMAAMVVMHKHRTADIPVVDSDKKLVGMASRARVGGLFLIDWLNHFDLQE